LLRSGSLCGVALVKDERRTVSALVRPQPLTISQPVHVSGTVSRDKSRHTHTRHVLRESSD